MLNTLFQSIAAPAEPIVALPQQEAITKTQEQKIVVVSQRVEEVGFLGRLMDGIKGGFRSLFPSDKSDNGTPQAKA